MTDQPDEAHDDSKPDQASGDRPVAPVPDPSGDIGDLGAESGTAPGQPAWGTRALAPRAGERLWIG